MPRLLKIGVAASGFCAVIFAVLVYGLNYDLYIEPLRLLFGMPFLFPILLLVSPILYILLCATCIRIGIPIHDLSYAYKSRFQYWRELLGVFLIIGAAASLLDAASLGKLPFAAHRQEPRMTLDEALRAYEAEEAQKKASANQGDAVAQFNLGLDYTKGQGVPQDYAEAAKWFRKSAEQGQAAAQTGLGELYSGGKGLPQDYSEAFKWYRKAADQGEAAAQTNLGVLYAEGNGIPQDYAEAAKWYRKAADQGEAAAQYNLGRLYVVGHGVTLDYEEAYFWLILASTSGDDKYTSFRGVPESHLTPPQIAAIQKRAREWKPTKG